MAQRGPLNKLVEYYSKPLSKDRIVYLNTLHGVESEKVELYRDFIISLTYIILDTYLGDDVTVNEDEYKSHFTWCWKKNITNFNLEKLIFEEHGEHYYYFYKYFHDVFYSREEKRRDMVNKFVDFWTEIMSVERLKTNSEYDLFINLYKIQTKNFKNNFS